MERTGAQILMETLIEQGVDTVFGYPGGAVLPIYDALYQCGGRLRHVLSCHEQGATHAADGYARATGKTGVVFATSGPGATNLVTGLATAYLDSTPLVAVTRNVPLELLGRDSFQEVDILGITMPITKHNYMVKDVRNLAGIIREAFHIANSGRPGPVLIDIPKNVQADSCEWQPGLPLPRQTACVPCESELQRAAALLDSCQRPFIYAGGGIISSGASAQLLSFAELLDAPVGASIMGLAGFPQENPRFVGMTGMHAPRPQTGSCARPI